MMRRIGSAAALSLALVLPAAAASAQTSDYPGGEEAGVLSENLQAPSGGGGTAGTGAARASVENPSRASGLAVTGTDAVQLAALGGALVIGGTVVVRRSRRRPASVTA